MAGNGTARADLWFKRAEDSTRSSIDRQGMAVSQLIRRYGIESIVLVLAGALLSLAAKFG